MMNSQEQLTHEIGEVPALLRHKASHWHDQATALLSRLKPRRDLVLLGRGSSLNACIYTSYLHTLRAGHQPITFEPWITDQHRPSTSSNWKDATVFAFSESGHGTEVARAAGWLRGCGAQVVGITNTFDYNCPLGDVSDELLLLEVGQELTFPATKSFMAQLFASAALCDFPLAEDADDIAATMELIIAGPYAVQLADFLQGAQTVFWIAGGPTVAAAGDAALKLQKVAGMAAQAMSPVEFLYGPIEATTEQDRVLLIAEGPRGEELQAIATHLLAHQTPYWLLTDQREPGDMMAMEVPLPAATWARAPTHALLGHLVVAELARRCGINPRYPAGLHRVTIQ